MTRRNVIRMCGAAIVSLLVAALAQPAAGQSLRSSVEPRARVFPSVGPGVTALKRDSSGHYYIIAKPATTVSVYDADGNLIEQIPNANSHGATIRYAVDMDLSSDGLLFVADRGANTIEIFKSDGSIVRRIPIVAPTSVVALPDGEFAVTSLTSKRLVQIMDESGNLVRNFGDPTDIEDFEGQETASKPLIAWGKIVASSTGDIYFGFTSLPEPVLRKYDRYGYVAYEASVPKNFFETRNTASTDRVQFTLNLTHLSLSDQTNGWFGIGSSGDVRFGGGMGTGLSRVLGSGGSFGRAAAMQMSMSQPAGNSPGGMAGGALGGMFSGQITDQGTQFQFGAGNLSSRGGNRGRNVGIAPFDQTASQGSILQVFGAGTDNTDQYNSSQVLAFTGVDSGSQSGITSETYAGADIGQNSNLAAAFAYGTMFNSVTFQPQGSGGGMFGRFPGGGSRFGQPDLGGLGGARPDADAHFGEGHFIPHGRFGAGEADVTATVRVNLGDIGAHSIDKPRITATAVDPSTGELWVGADDALIHFSKDGNPTEIYYLTMKGGVPLKPSAVLVEPDRFLIAADPWGIFEFARPK